MTVPPPPPPPDDDPFGIAPNQDTPPPLEEIEQPLDTGRPEVAAPKGKVLAVMAGLGAVLLFLLYQLFFTSEEVPEQQPTEREIVQAPPEPPEAPPAIAAPPTLPPVEPTLPMPPPNFAPPQLPEPTALPIITPEEDNAAREQLQARQRSPMIVGGGGGGGGLAAITGESTPGGTRADGNPNTAFETANALTEVGRSTATRIGNMRQIIAQGRIIQATLETAINTDLPAPIRAIVSRDVYGEAGKTPLIPKGSRLIGVYNPTILASQSRVFIVWQRVIRPDGVDIMVGSPGVDAIGQAGLAGQVDTKFQEIFSRAVLASAVSIAFAIGSEEITGGDGTSTSTSPLTGGTTTTSSGSTGAVNDALNSLGDTTRGFFERFIGQVQPTILVDQGTPVNVMVNRDLVFPADVAGAHVLN